MEGNPSIECINLQVPGNIEYCLTPKACFTQCMVKDKEVTMFSRGWNADMDPTKVTADNLHDSIIQSVKNKKFSTKSPRPKSSHPKAKMAKASFFAGFKAVDESNIDASQEGTNNRPHLRFVEPDRLEKEVQKAKKSDTGGMEKYSTYFPFKYTEYEIPVTSCFLAPNHYNSHQLDEEQLNNYMLLFAASATKMLRVQEMRKGGGSQELVVVYAQRKARIVVDPPPHVVIAISAIANEQAKALLKHLRDQWSFNGCPPRPPLGVMEGTSSRSKWDAFLRMARICVGVSFITKQAHMVTYSDAIFNEWIDIMIELEKGNKKPSVTVFRYLAGLDEEEVKKLQAEITDGTIVLSKGIKDTDIMDMLERIKQLKQDHIIQDVLLEEFNSPNEDAKWNTWEDLVLMYNINNAGYMKFLELCDIWIKTHLKRGIKNIDFPESARKYVEWTINLHKEKVKATDVPWRVYVNALNNMKDIMQQQCVGVLHHERDAFYAGSLQFFFVVVLFGKSDASSGLPTTLALGESATILDAGLLDINFQTVQHLSDKDFLRLKSKLLVKQFTKKYCIEGSKLVELFSNGYITEIGLEEKKEVVAIVENIEDQKNLESQILEFVTLHDDIKQWAGFQVNQIEHPVEHESKMVQKMGEGTFSAKDFLSLEASMY
ncbi:hypothetical protein L7F22_024382 [Adiantum nelumboides]|nr:hypothetical protein [Adiantum nelumboides]